MPPTSSFVALVICIAALGTAGGTVQNCVQIRRIDYTWDDIKCSAEKWFVCKK